MSQETVLDNSKIITWADYKKEDGEPTIGLLSQVSPDGKHVVSTVKDFSVFVPLADLAFSQLFFPIRGILGVYDRETGSFRELPGADDARFVQSNPVWSPDGEYLIFARSEAYNSETMRLKTSTFLHPKDCAEFLQGKTTFQYDLYRIPFNGGRGGAAQPIAGASDNGMSNTFPKVSPDGKWAYVGTGVTVDDTQQLLLLVINARTLQLHKVLAYPGSSFVHHHAGYTDAEGNDRVIVVVNRGPQFFLDPNDDHKVWRAITSEDVPMIGHTYPTLDPTNTYFYQSMDQTYYGNSHGEAGVTKIDMANDYDLERGRGGYLDSIRIWGLGAGGRPIGFAHTADGKFTYAVDGHNSYVFKIDNELNEVVGSTSAGVAGPYGICLNWDETVAFTVGKGEGSHNVGSVVGIIDLEGFRASRQVTQQPIYLGGSASSVDHCAMHPDPEVGEIWVSNMKGWETIVFDIETYEVTDWIATPNGGDTHGMAFVWYDNGWDSGELMVDMGGPKSATVKAMVLANADAAKAAADG